MTEFLNEIDTAIFLAVNGVHSPFFDSFMTLFTGRFIWIPMYVMVLWILFRNRTRTAAFIYLLMLVVAIAVTDQFCASVIRPAVERMRPSNPHNALSQFTYIVNEYRGGNYGFPSCHAANSFALAAFLSLLVKRWGFTVFIVTWAVLNSYSRLYLGVHYPGDLMAGALIGCAAGLLCCLAAARLAAIAERRTSPSPTSDNCAAPAPATFIGNILSAPYLSGTHMMFWACAATILIIILLSL